MGEILAADSWEMLYEALVDTFDQFQLYIRAWVVQMVAYHLDYTAFPCTAGNINLAYRFQV